MEQIVCTKGNQDIQDLLDPIWVCYSQEQPQEDYSLMIQEWLTNGLNTDSTLYQLKNVIGILDLEDLCVLLITSPPLKPYILFQWENNYITYTIMAYPEQPKIKRLYIMSNNTLHNFHSKSFPT